MDPRHESFKEALLNHLITTINFHIQSHLDEVINDTSLLDEIKRICRQIYHYLGISVDVDGILSKHNLLSIDVVLFPNVADTEANQILTDTAFNHLILEIKSILDQHHAGFNDEQHKKLEKSIKHLFQEYNL